MYISINIIKIFKIYNLIEKIHINLAFILSNVIIPLSAFGRLACLLLSPIYIII